MVGDEVAVGPESGKPKKLFSDYTEEGIWVRIGELHGIVDAAKRELDMAIEELKARAENARR